ncbi:MAG: DMT family transporter [Bacilli bacterium]
MKKSLPIFLAILAAALYALSIPVSKLLLKEVPSTLLAGFLYLGAGIGMSLVYGVKKIAKKGKRENSLAKSDFKYVLGMIVLDIAAPIFLLLALSKADALNVSLMSNFEIVATSLIALLLFKEVIGKKLWVGIVLITVASIVLSMDFSQGFTFSFFSLFALLASTCWGLENNCTRAISSKSPYQIVILKGLFSGLGSLVIGLIIGQRCSNWAYIGYALLLGFVSYGLSVFFYVIAQRYLGASKTSSFYAVGPFIGCGLSFLILGERPYFTFYIALGLMVSGLVFVLLDRNQSFSSSLKKANPKIENKGISKPS